MSQPGPDDEVVVMHRDQRPGRQLARHQPVPELGVHLHGPRILATSEQAAMALRSVYAYSWGVEVEVKAVRRKWDTQAGNNPVDGYRLGLAVSKAELVLHSLAPDSEGSGLPWLVGGGAVGGQIGFEFVAQSVLAFKPYPATGSLWLGWSWANLGLDEDSAEIALPDPGSFESALM